MRQSTFVVGQLRAEATKRFEEVLKQLVVNEKFTHSFIDDFKLRLAVGDLKVILDETLAKLAP